MKIKAAASRAKRERDQMNHDMWIREREAMRDWIKRQYYNNNVAVGTNLQSHNNSMNQAQESILVNNLLNAPK